MARLIQETIKKPLADEVLFGKLKAGGHVRVVVVKDEAGADKLGFEYLDGPVTPKPEKIPSRGAKPKRRPRRARSKPSGPKGDGGAAAAARLGAEGAAGQGLSGFRRNAASSNIACGACASGHCARHRDAGQSACGPVPIARRHAGLHLRNLRQPVHARPMQPPPRCPICDDERQFVPPAGQKLDHARRAGAAAFQLLPRSTSPA